MTTITEAGCRLNGCSKTTDCPDIRAERLGHLNRMEVIMATTKKQNTETKTQELSDVELSRASGGIIAVLQQKAQM